MCVSAIRIIRFQTFSRVPLSYYSKSDPRLKITSTPKISLQKMRISMK
jgi:hypothetical protein